MFHLESLHGRIAKALKWNLRDVQSMSLATLRDLIRPISPKLAEEISQGIQNSSHICEPLTN